MSKKEKYKMPDDVLETLNLSKEKQIKSSGHEFVRVANFKIAALSDSFRIYYYKKGLFERSGLMLKSPTVRNNILEDSKGVDDNISVLVKDLIDKMSKQSEIQNEIRSIVNGLTFYHLIDYSVFHAHLVLLDLVTKDECMEIICEDLDSKNLRDSMASHHDDLNNKVLTFIRLHKEANNLASLILCKYDKVREKLLVNS